MSNIAALANPLAAVQARLNTVAPKLGPTGQVSPKFEDKFDTFLNDLDHVSKLKGAVPTPMLGGPFALGLGAPVGPRDMAPPESGDVDCPGVASLKQTAQGCTLILAKGGFGGIGGVVTSYLLDSQSGTVQVTEMHQGFQGGKLPGMEFAPPVDPIAPKRDTYTLDLNQRSVEGFVSDQGWNLATV
jgi:hypothetical protein